MVEYQGTGSRRQSGSEEQFKRFLRTRKGSGSYDPLPCIDKQKKEWAAMLEIARGDAATSATVINTIQKIVTELSARADRWNALSPAEKNRQIAIQTEIMQRVQKSGNNMQRGLQTIINDPSRSQATRDAARTMLLVPKGGGSTEMQSQLCVCLFSFLHLLYRFSLAIHDNNRVVTPEREPLVW
jgi:hypothetical protein